MMRQMLQDAAAPALAPVILIVLVFALALPYVDPAPPKHIIITTGSDEGKYKEFAEQYRGILERDGITLEVRRSAGAVENIARLNDPNSDVTVGFAQDGLAAPAGSRGLVSLGSLYFEPVWIFSRMPAQISRLSMLRGKRIATGRLGGGTRSLALRMLAASGVNEKNSKLLAMGSADAATALLQGDVDTAFFVGTADTAPIAGLLRNPRVSLADLEQADAFTRQMPFLHHLVLPRGAIDLGQNIPDRDIDLVAPSATLIARDSLHPALIDLLLNAATEVHHSPGLFNHEHQFPADKDTDLPLADAAARFFKSGSPWLHRTLPFWLASLIDRLLVLIVPLVAILIPFTRIVPAVYGWRVRSRIFKWYGELKFIELSIEKNPDHEQCAALLKRLDWIDAKVNRIKIPLAFSHHVYILREHIDLVRRRLLNG